VHIRHRLRGGFETRRYKNVTPQRHAARDVSPREALYAVGDPLIWANRVRISMLALAARLPTIHNNVLLVESGG
jgi:hypothetical protein